MPRTNTSERRTFTRVGAITYTFSAVPSAPHIVTITLPPHSTWTTGPHWHETHTEHLRIIKGSILLTLDSTSKVHTRSSGTLTIPPFARHEWQRAPPTFAEGDYGDVDDVVVQEWTEPVDGEKEIFFRNLNSVIVDERGRGEAEGWWLMLQLWMVMAGVGDFPVLLTGLPRRVESWVTHVGLWDAVSLGGRWWGVGSVYEEYTHARMLEERNGRQGK